jgi:ABC-2 type transport system ATP-binding protein
VQPTPSIEAAGLTKTYPGGVRALDGLDLMVASGTVFGLVGPNGAGKSTTVKILTTLSRPDSGEARVAGVDVLREGDHVRRVIGCVAQQSGVDIELTGRENLMLQAHIHDVPRRRAKQRVSELLEQFGLTDAANRVVRTYSGGMRRKLDVAMGLVHKPAVLFLDEPTTGLDPEARAELWAEITRLSRHDGLTVLITTHYLEEADRLAARLAIVDRGRIVTEGTPDALKGELRGDAIQIELASDPALANGRVHTALARVDGLRDIVVDERALHARVDSGGRALPAVLAALEAHQIQVLSATISRPSLDDVYLRHTGRSFDRAHREAGTDREVLA